MAACALFRAVMHLWCSPNTTYQVDGEATGQAAGAGAAQAARLGAPRELAVSTKNRSGRYSEIERRDAIAREWADQQVADGRRLSRRHGRWDTYGRDAYGRDAYGRDAYGRDAYGRDAYGRDAYEGRRAACRRCVRRALGLDGAGDHLGQVHRRPHRPRAVGRNQGTLISAEAGDTARYRRRGVGARRTDNLLVGALARDRLTPLDLAVAAGPASFFAAATRSFALNRACSRCSALHCIIRSWLCAAAMVQPKAVGRIGGHFCGSLRKWAYLLTEHYNVSPQDRRWFRALLAEPSTKGVLRLAMFADQISISSPISTTWAAGMQK